MKISNDKINMEKPFTVTISGFLNRIKAAYSLILYGCFTLIPPYEIHEQKESL